MSLVMTMLLGYGLMMPTAFRLVCTLFLTKYSFDKSVQVIPTIRYRCTPGSLLGSNSREVKESDFLQGFSFFDFMVAIAFSHGVDVGSYALSKTAPASKLGPSPGICIAKPNTLKAYPLVCSGGAGISFLVASLALRDDMLNSEAVMKRYVSVMISRESESLI